MYHYDMHTRLSMLAILIILIIISTTAAQPKPDAAEQFLSSHNQARALVRVGPLVWSPKLATNARLVTKYQHNREGCKLANLQRQGSAHVNGANQMWTSYPASPTEVVESWLAERPYYNPATDTCAAGKQCGTYRQVVSKNTSQVGCAQATCTPGATITICFYFPPCN